VLLTIFVIFSPLQSHGPKVEENSLDVPLLKGKKRAGSKAPAVVLGEQSSMLHFFKKMENLHKHKLLVLILQIYKTHTRD
jgi:hypothetical protein